MVPWIANLVAGVVLVPLCFNVPAPPVAAAVPQVREGKPRQPRTDVDSAVQRGLRWLVDHQDESGFWDCDAHAGSPLNDVGVTSLSLLALLRAGNTLQEGPETRAVKAGFHWLRKIQNEEDGCFGPKSSIHFAYGHAMATLAMVEAYDRSERFPMLKAPAQRGLDFIARARNPYKAWRYSYPPDGDNDVSVTGWMLQALFAGRKADLNVDEAAIADAMLFLDEMTDAETGRTGYNRPGSPPAREAGDQDRWPPDKSESMTAVAMLARLHHGAKPQESEALQNGANLLLAQPPRWDDDRRAVDYYYWFFGTSAMRKMGERWWQPWQTRMLTATLPRQESDGEDGGSWNPTFDPWGDQGGRVYATALHVLCLQATLPRVTGPHRP